MGLSSGEKKNRRDTRNHFKVKFWEALPHVGGFLAGLKGEGRREPVGNSGGRRQPGREDRWASRCRTFRAVTQRSGAAIRL